MDNMSDRELLIKLQQQLQNDSSNHGQMSEALKEIFVKVDRQSKTSFGLESKLNTVEQTNTLKHDQTDKDVQSLIKNTDKAIATLTTDLEKSESEVEELKGFVDETKGALKFLKTTVGIGMFILAALQLGFFIFSMKGK